jgi:hypothetical protein
MTKIPIFLIYSKSKDPSLSAFRAHRKNSAPAIFERHDRPPLDFPMAKGAATDSRIFVAQFRSPLWLKRNLRGFRFCRLIWQSPRNPCQGSQLGKRSTTRPYDCQTTHTFCIPPPRELPTLAGIVSLEPRRF